MCEILCTSMEICWKLTCKTPEWLSNIYIDNLEHISLLPAGNTPVNDNSKQTQASSNMFAVTKHCSESGKC